jgi:hypothetical protein
MVSYPALITGLAGVDGRDRKTLDYIGRTLREEGHIPTAKRGGGAADMGVREAVNCLIAFNGADGAQSGGLAIDRFRALAQSRSGNSKTLREFVDSYPDQCRPIQRVMDSRTFGEALEQLIDGVPELVSELRRLWREAIMTTDWPDTDELFHIMMSLRRFGLDVTFTRRWGEYSAMIELYTWENDEDRYHFPRRIFRTDFVADRKGMQNGLYDAGPSDREVTNKIGAPTLIAAWRALNPGLALPGVPERAPSASALTDEELSQ